MTTAPDGFDIRREVGLFLGTSRTASLATVNAAGLPCAANIQFALARELQLIWVSSQSSAHSVNIAAQPRVAITVYAHDDQVHNIHGLQMQGHAQPIHDHPQLAAAWDIYVEKFTFAAEPPFRDLLKQQTFYRFNPTWLRWIDNRRAFGFRHEEHLPTSGSR